MTKLESERVCVLLGASFHGHDGFAHRLVDDLNARGPSGGISSGEAAQLARLAWTYRRQIPANLHPPGPPPEVVARSRAAALAERERQKLATHMAQHAPERLSQNRDSATGG